MRNGVEGGSLVHISGWDIRFIYFKDNWRGCQGARQSEEALDTWRFGDRVEMTAVQWICFK